MNREILENIVKVVLIIVGIGIVGYFLIMFLTALNDSVHIEACRSKIPENIPLEEWKAEWKDCGEWGRSL